jgi:hypothetical protein
MLVAVVFSGEPDRQREHRLRHAGDHLPRRASSVAMSCACNVSSRYGRCSSLSFSAVISVSQTMHRGIRPLLRLKRAFRQRRVPPALSPPPVCGHDFWLRAICNDFLGNRSAMAASPPSRKPPWPLRSGPAPCGQAANRSWPACMRPRRRGLLGRPGQGARLWYARPPNRGTLMRKPNSA